MRLNLWRLVTVAALATSLAAGCYVRGGRGVEGPRRDERREHIDHHDDHRHDHDHDHDR